MKSSVWLIMVFCARVVFAADGAGDFKLEPDATVRLAFPDLPDTLESMASGERQPARLTATLPTNYTREGKFPLFIFLDGDAGGRGDGLPIPGRTVAPRDFICASLPLFKRAYGGTNDSTVVMMEDYETVSRAYRTMLQKLYGMVPNVTAERSALGGFSNGAHTVGVLLARRDEFILQHFRAFYLIEGGFGSLAATVAAPGVAPALRDCRILLLYGDQPLPNDDPTRIVNDHLARACALRAKENHFDLTSVIMHGYGHELPPDYLALLGQWVRGEKLPDAVRR